MSSDKLVRGLGLTDSICIVVGCIIGTGVFLKTSTMLQQTGSPITVIWVWIFAGVLSLFGALAYAELGCLFPDAGGEYVYLRKAYGDLPAFLYGWMRFWIASPCTIAAYAVGAATFLSSGLLPLESIPGGKTIFAILTIFFFSGINCLTVVFSGRIQTFLTFMKTLMIIGLGVAVFCFSNKATWSHFNTPSDMESWKGWTSFGTAMIAALWAYDGWNNLPMLGGEIKNPQRNIPLSLGLGMFVILAVYLLVNVAYFYALPFQEVLTSSSTAYPDALPVATKAAQTFLGPMSIKILSFAFVLSAIGALNGSVLSGARVPYAMATDGLFFKKLAHLSQKTRVPIWSVLIQCVWSSVLAASGSFDQLTDYVVFSSWIFYGLVTSSVIYFRRTMPDAPRAYRTPGYPWIPLLFVAVSCVLLANTIYTIPRESTIGLLLITLGIPVFYWFKRAKGMRLATSLGK